MVNIAAIEAEARREALTAAREAVQQQHSGMAYDIDDGDIVISQALAAIDALPEDPR